MTSSSTGRVRVNSRESRKRARHKEEADIERVSKILVSIPRYSDRYILFRKNRRQKAKELAQSTGQVSNLTAQHPIFAANRFTDFPLSKRTLDGLTASGFSDLTAIQRIAIPQALAGRDVLAAAPTGSGKTLSFIVPIMEVLWRDKWNTMDGLGALILSPTRELSMQIFDVLRSVARFHLISAGLVIGGKDFEGERDKVGTMNVLVGTPGRLLHHMDHVVDFDCSSLKILILDEADRILDMGFSNTLNAIMRNIPSDRQTLLFSATQTKDVKALARLSLKSPEYVSISSNSTKSQDDISQHPVNDEKPGSTGSAEKVNIVGVPNGLSQSCTVVKLQDKLSVLWSFIRSHLRSKIIIFLSSGKQVRFVFETFCKLRPGMPLLHLHGGMKQLRRTEMYDAFCRTKSAALFATDVASRGLDFPDVGWVVQADCPDDVSSYIHRVGRTARFKASGRAMLILNEGKEENFLKRLEEKNLNLHMTRINPGRLMTIAPKVTALVTSSQELHNLAQRAFVFYLKSIHQKPDKDIFDVNDIDVEALARSFGLSVTPKVSFKAGRHDNSGVDPKMKNKTVFGYDKRHAHLPSETHGDSVVKSGISDDPLSVKASVNESDVDDGDDDVLSLKRTHLPHDIIETDQVNVGMVAEAEKVQRARKKRKLDLLKGMPSVNRIVFDEDGNRMRAGDVQLASDEDTAEEKYTGIEDYASSISQRLAEGALEDKKRESERVKALHAKQRQKKRNSQQGHQPQAPAAASEDDPVEGYDMSAGSNDEGSICETDELTDDDKTSAGTKDEIAMEEQEKLALKILQARQL